MTKEDIERIIAQNIRTNGRGEITAQVMAGVLYDFVAYIDTGTDDFEALVRALADAYAALVEEMEGKFENKAVALEAAFEAFSRALLTDQFEPWAEALAQALTAKMDATKGSADDAKGAAQDAKSAAQDAKTTAGEAKTAAETASGKANDAKTAAVDAKDAAQSAELAIDAAADGVAQALDAILRGNETPYLSLGDTLTLAGAANFIQALAPVQAGTIAVASTAYAALAADETEYTYESETYVGVIALAAAKGWEIIDSNL